jgi:hypothetical protein
VKGDTPITVLVNRINRQMRLAQAWLRVQLGGEAEAMPHVRKFG